MILTHNGFAFELGMAQGVKKLQTHVQEPWALMMEKHQQPGNSVLFRAHLEEESG